jgi:hypothetical protein
MQPVAEPEQYDLSWDPSSGEPPPEPPMQVVTQGWWILRRERVPRAVLEAEDREAERKRAEKARKRAARPSLKSLIFGRG